MCVPSLILNAFLNEGVISGAYSAYDLADFLLALDENSPLRIYALSDWLRQTFPPMLTKFEIYRRWQVPFIAYQNTSILPLFIAYQNTSILPLYVLGKWIDAPSCNVKFNERKVDRHEERSLGNLFWLHSTWWYPGGKEHCGLLSLHNFSE